MKTTNCITIAALAAALSLSLVACSGGAASSSASAGTTSNASASSTASSTASASTASASSSSAGGPTTDDNTTDQMSDRHESQAVVNIVVKNGRVQTVEYGYPLDYFPGIEDLREGATYKLVADVTYLNGGVAGYVDFPKIEKVYSIEEVPAQ